MAALRKASHGQRTSWQATAKRILRHCGLWNPLPPPNGASLHNAEGDDDSSAAVSDLTYVDEETF